jgi:uncharacterized protein (TIGR03086 family)
VASSITHEKIVDQNTQAVRATVRVVALVNDVDLGRPTPCAGWNLGDLLAHMTVQHDGFAAAAAGDGADLGRWQTRRFDPETLVAEYVLAAGRIMDVFGDPGVLDRHFFLPQVSTRTMFPARQAIGFHLVDCLVHGWDVARALGLPYEPEPDLVCTALTIARTVPDDARRMRPGAPFKPAIRATVAPPPAEADGLDEVLAWLGRRPGWITP